MAVNLVLPRRYRSLLPKEPDPVPTPGPLPGPDYDSMKKEYLLKRCLICTAAKTAEIPKKLRKLLEITLHIAVHPSTKIRMCLDCRKKLIRVDQLITLLHRNYIRSKANIRKLANLLDEHNYHEWKTDSNGQILEEEPEVCASSCEFPTNPRDSVSDRTTLNRKGPVSILKINYEAPDESRGSSPEPMSEEMSEYTNYAEVPPAKEETDQNVDPLMSQKGDAKISATRKRPKTLRKSKKKKTTVTNLRCGCGFEPDSCTNFAEHRKVFHNGLYVCGVEGCGKKFSRKSSLKRHTFRHNPGSYACQICGMELRSPTELSLHKRRFHHAVITFSGQLNSLIPGGNIIETAPVNPVIKSEQGERQEAAVMVDNVEDDEDSKNVTSPGKFRIEEHPCPVCDATYQHGPYFGRHIENHHWKVEDGQLVCIRCSEKFTSLEAMLSHAREHRTAFQKCSKCELVYPTPERFLNHVKTDHEHDKGVNNMDSLCLVCDICDESFTTKGLLSHHRLLIHGATTLLWTHRPKYKYCCTQCDMSFTQEIRLNRHMRVHLKGKTLLETNNEMCENCLAIFPDEKSRAHHMAVCQAPATEVKGNLSEYPCCICDATFDKEFNVEQHISSAHWAAEEEHLKCTYCVFACTDVAEMAQHSRVHRADMMPCRSCPDAVFFNETHLSMHRENFHDTGAPAKDTFNCPVCETQTCSKSLLALHHLICHGQNLKYDFATKIHVCPICKRSFALSAYLKRHYRMHSIGRRRTRRNLECPTCKKVFQVKQLLDLHISERQCAYDALGNPVEPLSGVPGEDGTSQCLCALCGKMFTSVRRYRAHLSDHDGVQHECGVCGKKFGNTGYLKRHMQCHKKSYACDKCPARFASSNHLKEHEVIHTNKKDWVCEVCAKAFRWRMSLKYHLWQAHKIGKQPKSTIQKRIVCTVCDTKMSSRNLRRHFKVCHPGITFNIKYGQDLLETSPDAPQRNKKRKKTDEYHQPGPSEIGQLIVEPKIQGETYVVADPNVVQIVLTKSDEYGLAGQQLVRSNSGEMVPIEHVIESYGEYSYE